MWLVRNLNCEFIARTAGEGMQLLQQYAGQIECVCLDHDLGEKLTGYDVACWALERDLMPRHVQLVTSNPVGRKNISDALIVYKYSTKNGIDFYR